MVIRAISSIPEVCAIAETSVTSSVGVATCRNSRKARGIVTIGGVSYGAGLCTAVPNRSRSQCLSNVVGRVVAKIATLVANIRSELFQLGSARHVPACGTDTLHPAGIGTTGRGISHYRLPIVQQSVGGFVGRVIVGIVPIASGARMCAAIRNGSAVGILRGFKVLFHPTLGANLNSVVSVALNVGEG